MLEVSDLHVTYETSEKQIHAVHDVSFSVDQGEIIAIVGESGCGKSTIAKTILQILPSNARVEGGSIELLNNPLLELSKRELDSRIRWKQLAWIPQNAMNALDPVYKIGALFDEVLEVHTALSKSERKNRTKSLLEMVNIDPERANDYSHQLSGGQRQRVTIALSMALDPNLLIADEPTTGLDVIVQDNLLSLLKRIQSGGQSIIFITHDIHAAAELADRIIVMYGGSIMELGEIDQVLESSAHPYTVGLMNSTPSLDRSKQDRLLSIPGAPPEFHDLPVKCEFIERCPFAESKCTDNPPLVEVGQGHRIRCHYPDRSEEFRKKGANQETWEEP